MNLTSNFQDRLIDALENLGVSASDLASAIGLSKQAISTYVTGVRQPKRPVIMAIAEYLKISPAWLMGYDVSKHEEKPITASDDELSILLEDPLNAEFFEKYKQLNPEHKKMLIAQIQGLLEHHADK